jgi:hypothetical protein
VIQSVRTALEKRSADTEESKDVEGVLEILHEHRPKLRTLEWCCLGCRQHMKTQALIMLEHAPLCDDDAETPADESAAFAAHAADGVAGVAAPRQTRGQQAAAPLLLFAQLNDRAATGVGATPQAEAVLQRKRDWLTSLWDSLDDKSAVQLASTCKALWSADDFTAKRSRTAAWFAFTLEESKAKLDDVRRQKNKALRKLKGEKKDKKEESGGQGARGGGSGGEGGGGDAGGGGGGPGGGKHHGGAARRAEQAAPALRGRGRGGQQPGVGAACVARGYSGRNDGAIEQPMRRADQPMDPLT